MEEFETNTEGYGTAKLTSIFLSVPTVYTWRRSNPNHFLNSWYQFWNKTARYWAIEIWFYWLQPFNQNQAFYLTHFRHFWLATTIQNTV